MSTTTQTLSAWLLEQIAADEESARAATPGPWAWEPPSKESWPDADESLVALDPDEEWQPDSYFGGCSEFLRDFHGTRDDGNGGHLHRTTRDVVSGWGYDASGTTASDEDRAHIATHDPARVLRQCAALRAVVELHGPLNEDAAIWVCRSCQPPATWPNGEAYPCPTLRALATIYADRPGADAFLGES